MKILPSPTIFDWDSGNSFKNFDKHNVTMQEAEETFFNKPLILHEDVRHSTTTEQRYYGLGHTNAGRHLFVAFTIRDNKIRVISIRDMKKTERKFYEKA